MFLAPLSGKTPEALKYGFPGRNQIIGWLLEGSCPGEEMKDRAGLFDATSLAFPGDTALLWQSIRSKPFCKFQDKLRCDERGQSAVYQNCLAAYVSRSITRKKKGNVCYLFGCGYPLQRDST